VNIRFKPHVKYQCTLMNATGQTVAQWACQDFYQFNATTYANGMYYLNIESNDWNYTQKMQISH